jgi:hydroxymethylbilane synthase
LEQLLQRVRTGGQENARAPSPSPHRYPRQPDGAASDRSRAHPNLAAIGAIEIVTIRTTGDRVQNRLLDEIGGKGLFAKEIEEALLARHIDFAVHSLKDLETWLPDRLALACVLPRDDPRDALLSAQPTSLASLSRSKGRLLALG